MSVRDQDRDRDPVGSDRGASAGSPPTAPATAGRRVSLPVLSVVAEATADTAAAIRDARRPWRSIAEKEGSPVLAAAAAREFPPGASELTDVNRRSFMQLLGSGAAMAGVAACSQP